MTSLEELNGFNLDRLPQNDKERLKAEAVIEEELKKLSLEEHEKILFDIYGIGTNADSDDDDDEDNNDEDNSEDDPLRSKTLGYSRDTNNTKLKEMELELLKIPPTEKQAFLSALALDQDYVQSNAFRKLFLQSENYNCKEAAALFVRHFEMKKEMFGVGPILSRDIRLADLSPRDRSVLESGFIQISPSRDAAGRVVRFISPTALKGAKEESVVSHATFVVDAWNKPLSTFSMLFALYSIELSGT
jgi:hypothetical protein